MQNVLTVALLVGLLYSLVTLGLGLAFRVLNYPDLTLEGGMVFGATASLLSLKATGSIPVSLLVAFAAGGLAGAMTATVHLHLRVSKLLSGIVTSAVLYSINIRLLGKISVVRYTMGPTLFTPNQYTAQPQLKSILLLAVIVAFAMVVLLLFFRTRSGLLLRGLGEDDRFLSGQGSNPRAYLFAGLIGANALIGLCGGLVFHFYRVVDVNLTAGMLIAALAALMVGESVVHARSMWQHLCACVVGTILYQAFVTLVLLGLGGALRDLVVSSDVRLFTGICLIVPYLVVARRRSDTLFASTW